MCVEKIRLLFSAYLLFLKEGIDNLIKYIFIFRKYYQKSVNYPKLLYNDK